jgi:phage-related protein (TIGR01555 family)
MPDGAPPLLRDSYRNLISSLGTPRDKSASGQFLLRRRLFRYEIDALYYQSPLGGKIVDIPAEDGCRAWRQFIADRVSVAAIEEAEYRLGIRQAVLRGLKLARKDGGSAIYLGTDDRDPSQPIDPARLGKGSLRYVKVFSRYEVQARDIDRDPASEFHGEPMLYELSRPDGSTLAIHPSRMVPFIGVERGDRFEMADPWGDSVYERLHDAIRDASAALSGAAALVQEGKIDIIKIKGLTDNVVRDDYRQAVLTRFGLAATAKSIVNTLLLDGDEEWDQKQVSFAGWDNIIDRFLLVLAGSADIPVTRLLGRSPAGLNSTGESDLENYYTMISAHQETTLRPALQRLDDALVRSAMGRSPRGIRYEWRPLWSIPEKEKAENALKHAQAIKHYAETMLFESGALAEAAANQLDESDFLPGILEAIHGPDVGPRTPRRPVAPPVAGATRTTLPGNAFGGGQRPSRRPAAASPTPTPNSTT